jgi:hypothetical protein
MKLKILFYIVLSFIISNAKDYVVDIHGTTANIEFMLKGEKLYFGREEVTGIDPLTFQKVNDYYVKDKNGLYYINAYGMIISGAAENIMAGNWYESSLEGDDQWYGVEMVKQKVEHIGFDYNSVSYKVYNMYLFIDGKVYKRGEVISDNLNLNYKNIEFLYKRCQVVDREERCDILIKHGNDAYILIDKLDFYGENKKNTEIYEINNIKFTDLEKAFSEKNNYINGLDNLIKKAKKINI